MNDPHVTWLRYRLVTRGSVVYGDPPALSNDQDAYHLTLEKGVLTVELKGHHATIRSARECVQPDLRAWELHTALNGPDRLKFEYIDAKRIDRNPPPPGTPVHVEAEVTGVCIQATVGTADVRVVCQAYPPPPSRFRATALVEDLWERYSRCLEGKEPLAAFGYFILSCLEDAAGGRTALASKYAIDRKVLSKMGDLTTTVGDAGTARKIDEQSKKRAHTGAELGWIKTFAKMLILRAGEYQCDPPAPLRQITMADLPKL